jgi:hypothetical protein
MNSTVRDGLARRTGAAQDRRSSLKVLGLAALVVGGLPGMTIAKRGKKRKDRCKTQVGPCKQSLGILCEGMGTQQCFANVDTCCAFLRDCDAAHAVACIVDRFII